ncbi:hypothetical protein BGZ76_007059, partial [Entomortierella beljakovae]
MDQTWAQNRVQLESSLTIRKRKLEEDDDVCEDKSIPMKSYGIVTDAVYWYFLECSIDQSGDVSASDPNRAKFRISKLDEIINYQKDKWREENERGPANVVRALWASGRWTSESEKLPEIQKT